MYVTDDCTNDPWREATDRALHAIPRGLQIADFTRMGHEGLGRGLVFSTCAGDQSERSGLLQTHAPWAPSTGLVAWNPRTNMLRASLCV
jgi:hypothetical protein